MSLDTPAAILCGIASLLFFALHALTGSSQQNWMNIPNYVRHGFFYVGAVALWRGVTFYTNADDPTALGHINPEGMLMLIGVTYIAGTLVFWTASRPLPNGLWAWIREIRQDMQQTVKSFPHADAEEIILRTDKISKTLPRKSSFYRRFGG